MVYVKYQKQNGGLLAQRCTVILGWPTAQASGHYMRFWSALWSPEQQRDHKIMKIVMRQQPWGVRSEILMLTSTILMLPLACTLGTDKLHVFSELRTVRLQWKLGLRVYSVLLSCSWGSLYCCCRSSAVRRLSDRCWISYCQQMQH